MKNRAQSTFKSLTDLPSETMAAVDSVSKSAAEMTQQLFGTQMQHARIPSDQPDDLRRDQTNRWQERENDSRYWRRGGLNE